MFVSFRNAEAGALRTPTTQRPASAFASAMTPTVRLSLSYCSIALQMIHNTIRLCPDGAIVDELAANLVARKWIGHIGAAQLLFTAGDSPERLGSEANFASLCGVSPVPVSSGNTVWHRLNRGGDRAANSALHIIGIGRLRTDQRTKDYVARRLAKGHSKLYARRALKRCLAREVSTLIAHRRKEINATRIAA